MRRNTVYKKIPAALAAFVLAIALCCQTAAAGRTLVPGGYTVGIKLYAEGLMVTEVESGTPAQQAGIRKAFRQASRSLCVWSAEEGKRSFS